MKKIFLLLAAMGVGSMALQAQEPVKVPIFWANWSLGINGGVTTPLTNHAFFGSMRGMVGLNLDKQISPIFGLGVEGIISFNSSAWNNPVKSEAYANMDRQYVGAYGTVNLTNLFCGFRCEPRKFTIDAVLGAGWGHDCWANTANIADRNYFATKAGVDFNFNVLPSLTLSLKPSVIWNMSDAGVAQTSAAYNANRATFNCMVGVAYNFNPRGFKCVTPESHQAEIDALNEQINQLRILNSDCAAAVAATSADLAASQAALDACNAQGPKVVTNTVNQRESTRYIFFKNASSVITNDQMPNVEMIAQYMKNHVKSTVLIEGYASKTGPEELNIKLANARAESVKNALIKKYGIKADRIKAEGKGIGDAFSEESWNRVSICTLDNK